MAPQQREKLEIKKSKLLLVEGADAKFFCIWALAPFGVDEVQVLDFGGITELSVYLKTLSGLPDYEKVTTIVIARDAEINPATAVNNIKTALRQVKLSVPANPFEFAETIPRIAFMLFPGFDDKQKLVPGALEDLCVKIIKDSDNLRFDCVKAYLACLEAHGQKIQWRHKSFLHTYFAGENSFVGMKIGEASKAGAWNWDHETLKPFKEIIKAM